MWVHHKCARIIIIQRTNTQTQLFIVANKKSNHEKSKELLKYMFDGTENYDIKCKAKIFVK